MLELGPVRPSSLVLTAAVASVPVSPLRYSNHCPGRRDDAGSISIHSGIVTLVAGGLPPFLSDEVVHRVKGVLDVHVRYLFSENRAGNMLAASVR